MTEVGLLPTGQQLGKPVGDEVWTSHKLPPTGWDNIERHAERPYRGGIIYGCCVPLFTTRTGHNDIRRQRARVKVWLNGVLIYEHPSGRHASSGLHGFSPGHAERGRNVLLVAVESR